MVENIEDELPGLKSLATEALAGRLRLDPTVAGDLAKACDDLIRGFQGVKRSGRFLEANIGLGDFMCGHGLSKELRDAVSGDGGLFPRLDQHIQAVGLIREIATGQVAALVRTDEASGTGIAGTEH